MTEMMRTEVSRAEFEALQRVVRKNSAAIARQETQYAVINTKLTAILWLLSTVGAAMIAVAVRAIVGGVV